MSLPKPADGPKPPPSDDIKKQLAEAQKEAQFYKSLCESLRLKVVQLEDAQNKRLREIAGLQEELKHAHEQRKATQAMWRESCQTGAVAMLKRSGDQSAALQSLVLPEPSAPPQHQVLASSDPKPAPKLSGTIDRSRWKPSYSSAEIQKIAKLQKHVRRWLARRRTMNRCARAALEILTSERNYVRSLDNIHKVFIAPLSHAGLQQQLGVTAEDVQAIFSNLPDILGLAQAALNELEVQFAAQQPLSIGKIFIRLAPMLKIYSTFINNFEASQAALVRLGERPAFKSWLKTAEKANAPLLDSKLIEDFLINPVQRVPQYELLLKNLMSTTPVDAVQYPSIAAAVRAIQETNSFLNEQKRHHSNGLRLARLHRILSAGAEQPLPSALVLALTNPTPNQPGLLLSGVVRIKVKSSPSSGNSAKEAAAGGGAEAPTATLSRPKKMQLFLTSNVLFWANRNMKFRGLVQIDRRTRIDLAKDTHKIVNKLMLRSHPAAAGDSGSDSGSGPSSGELPKPPSELAGFTSHHFMHSFSILGTGASGAGSTQVTLYLPTVHELFAWLKEVERKIDSARSQVTVEDELLQTLDEFATLSAPLPSLRLREGYVKISRSSARTPMRRAHAGKVRRRWVKLDTDDRTLLVFRDIDQEVPLDKMDVSRYRIKPSDAYDNAFQLVPTGGSGSAFRPVIIAAESSRECREWLDRLRSVAQFTPEVMSSPARNGDRKNSKKEKEKEKDKKEQALPPRSASVSVPGTVLPPYASTPALPIGAPRSAIQSTPSGGDLISFSPTPARRGHTRKRSQSIC